MGDYLFQILAHSRQLTVQVLGQRVYLLSLRIDVPGVGERSLQWLQYLLQLRLLAGHEVQLMLQSLLVQPDRVHLLVESDYLVPILNEELVPGVHLSGLVDEHLLQIL